MSKVPMPQGRYVLATRDGDIVFTAGMTPRNDGVLILRGRVEASEPLETYREAVEQAASNALRAAQSLVTNGERIAKVLNMTVYIAAYESFDAHAKIADFASIYLWDMLGDAGIGSRSAIGVQSLPGGAPVELALVVAVAGQ